MDKHLCISGPKDGEYIECESEYFVAPEKISVGTFELGKEGSPYKNPKDIVYRKISLADGANSPGEPPKYFHAFLAQDGDERGVIERLIAGYQAGE